MLDFLLGAWLELAAWASGLRDAGRCWRRFRAMQRANRDFRNVQISDDILRLAALQDDGEAKP